MPLGDSLVSLRFDRGLPAATVRLLSRALNALPGLAEVSPDLVVTSDAVPPNDSYFPQQTNLWSPTRRPRTPARRPRTARLQHRTRRPCGTATQGRKSVVVAIVDGGIVAHPDLARQTVPGYDMIADSRNAKDGAGRDSNAADPGNSSNGTYCAAHASTWHGTHVAGIVACPAQQRDRHLRDRAGGAHPARTRRGSVRRLAVRRRRRHPVGVRR